MVFFKFHQNRKINEEFNFWGVKREGEGCPDFKNSEKPHKERWSQTAPKISALKLNQKVFKNERSDLVFVGVINPYRLTRFKKIEKASYRKENFIENFSTLA